MIRTELFLACHPQEKQTNNIRAEENRFEKMNNVQFQAAPFQITRSTISTTPETKLIIIFALLLFKASALPPIVKIGKSTSLNLISRMYFMIDLF